MSIRKMLIAIGLFELIICELTPKARSEIIMELKNPAELEEQADAPQPAAPPKTSELSFQFHIPLDKLSTIINQFKFTIPAGGDSVTSVRLSASSSGVSSYPLQLRVPIKLHVVGTDLDGAVSLNVGIGIGADGCPLKFQPPLVDFPGGGIVGGFVSQKVASEITAQLACDRIREQLGKLWKTFEVPIEIGSNAIYANFGPQKVAISDLSVDGSKKEVIFSGSLSAIVTLTSKGGQGPKAPPMNLGHIDSPFPAWSPETIKFLIEQRGVTAIGHEAMDTDTTDKMESETYILQHGHFQIEVMANLDKVPPKAGSKSSSDSASWSSSSESSSSSLGLAAASCCP
jgi:hypothetical protein